MITLGKYIQNSKGEKAYAGDKIKLSLLNGKSVSSGEICLITDIRLNGDVMLNGCVCQNVAGIEDFSICK